MSCQIVIFVGSSIGSARAVPKVSLLLEFPPMADPGPYPEASHPLVQVHPQLGLLEHFQGREGT